MRSSDDREPVRFEWEPIGPAGRARILAIGADTGSIADIDTIDLSRAADLTGYARRIAGRIGNDAASTIEGELRRIAVERLGLHVPVAKPPQSLRDALDEWAATDDVPRIETAFRPLDDLAGGGLPRGSLTVIAGQPGAGKSALALQLVAGALLVDRNLKAVWGLGEMSLEALARRAVAVGSVLLGSDRPVTLDAAGRRTGPAKAIADSLRDTIADRLVIAAPLTLDRVEAAIEATGAGLVVIDYLQLVQGDSASDRRQEVDAVVRRLRELTIARGLALVAISNIAKTVSRDSRIGALGKESAEIDFASDLFLLGEPDAEEDENGLRLVRWRCMKNRHGRPRDIEAMLDGSLQLFTALDSAPFPEFANFSQGERL